jgi:hypothetical protein
MEISRTLGVVNELSITGIVATIVIPPAHLMLSYRAMSEALSPNKEAQFRALCLVFLDPVNAKELQRNHQALLSLVEREDGEP